MWTQKQVDKIADRFAEIMVEQVKAVGGKAKIVKSKRVNKWLHVLVIQGNYGNGWEDESEYTRRERKQAYTDLKEYRIASPSYGHRLITRRVLNPDYKAA